MLMCSARPGVTKMRDIIPQLHTEHFEQRFIYHTCRIFLDHNRTKTRIQIFQDMCSAQPCCTVYFDRQYPQRFNEKR